MDGSEKIEETKWFSSSRRNGKSAGSVKDVEPVIPNLEKIVYLISDPNPIKLFIFDENHELSQVIN